MAIGSRRSGSSVSFWTIDNARDALAARDARWGSLYGALYGSDVISGRAPDGCHDLARGQEVTAWAHAFLDHASPAVGSSVPASPPVVTLWFTQDLEPAFSAVTRSP